MVRLAAFLLLLASAARADIVRMQPFESGNRSLGLQLGNTRPSEPGFRETVRPGIVANVQAQYYVSDWIAVGAELGYSRFFKKSFTTPGGVRGIPASSDYNSEAQALEIAGLVRINFFERSIWTPYVLGGAGFHRFEQTVNAVTPGSTPGTVETVSTSAGTIGLLVTAGAGIEVFAVRDASVSFEARFRQFRLDGDKFFNDAESLSFMLGFHFWWGRDW